MMAGREDLNVRKLLLEKKKEPMITAGADEPYDPELEPALNEAADPAEKEKDDGNKKASAAEDEEGEEEELDEADQEDVENEELAEGENDEEILKEENDEDAAEGAAVVRQGRATAAKEMPRWRRNRNRNRHQSDFPVAPGRNTNIQDQRRQFQLAGLIFLCSAVTKKDCFNHHVFGFPESKRAVVEKVKKGMKLFLFDIDQKLLHGIYKASSEGGMELVPEAFQTSSQRKFPAQVRFHIHKDCLPLLENEFRHAIKDNYFSGGKFQSELTSEQVGKLMRLFRPLPPLLHRGRGQLSAARGFPQLHREENVRRDHQQASNLLASRPRPGNQRLSIREGDHGSVITHDFPMEPRREPQFYTPREHTAGSWHSREDAGADQMDFRTHEYRPEVTMAASAAAARVARTEAELLLYKRRYEEAQAAADEAKRAAYQISLQDLPGGGQRLPLYEPSLQR